MAVKEGYKQTEIGLIPEDWEVKTMSHVTDVRDGTHESPKYHSSGVKFVTSKNIVNGILDFSEITFISEDDAEHINKRSKVDIDDILMAMIGTIGDAVLIDRTPDFCIKNVALIKPYKDKIYPKYLYQLVVSNVYQNYIQSKLAGGIQKFISLSMLRSLYVVIPPLPEQKAIATALSDIDGLINSLSKLIEKKKKIKQGVMQELLTGKKRLKGFSGEWVETTLEELCYLVTKQTGFDYSKEIKPSLKVKKDVDCFPFIQNKDFEGRTINYNTDYYIPKDVAYKYPNILLNEKCLLVSISGRIGNIGVFDNIQQAFIGGAVGIARFRDKSLIDWVLLYLQSKDGQNQIISKKKAGAQHNLTVFDVRKLIIPLPRKEEAERIGEIIFSMDTEIEKLQVKLNKYKAIKQGMMQELLTGKTRLLEGA